MAQNAQQTLGQAPTLGAAPTPSMMDLGGAPSPAERSVMQNTLDQRKTAQEGIQTAQQNMVPAPKPPSAQELAIHPQQAQSFMPLMLALSAIGGFATRQPMVAALNNMSAVMKGQLEGDQAVTKHHEEQLWKNFDAGMAAHKASIEDLNQAYKKYEDTGNLEDLRLELITKFGPQEAARLTANPQNVFALIHGNQQLAISADKQAKALKAQAEQKSLDRQTRLKAAEIGAHTKTADVATRHKDSKENRINALRRDTNKQLSLTTNPDKIAALNSRLQEEIAAIRAEDQQGAAPAAGAKPTPTAEDIAYAKAHPDTKAAFVAHFGREP